MSEEKKTRKWGWKKTTAVVLGILASFLVFGALGLHLLITNGIKGSSAYLDSDFSTLSVKVMSYEREDGTELLLLPMSHIAQESFYQEINEELKSADIILTEGVNDRHNLFKVKGKIGYGNIADALGLAEQKPFLDNRAVNADGDMSALSKDSVEYLKKLFSLIAVYKTDEFMASLQKFSEYNEKNPEVAEQTMKEILTIRNAVLLESLQSILKDGEALRGKIKLDQKGMENKANLIAARKDAQKLGEKRETQAVTISSLYQSMNMAIDNFMKLPNDKKRLIAIPWGAKHFDELVPEFEKMGFAKKEEKKLEVARFAEVYSAILSNIFSSAE